jgi:dipeptidyl-peptidase-3
LIDYYKTGDLRTFDEYNIAWVQDTESKVDVINGFIETYGDPMDFRGAFESVVSFVDPEATKRIAAIGREAQWFEDNSPIMAEHKKKNVTGISQRSLLWSLSPEMLRHQLQLASICQTRTGFAPSTAPNQ